MACSILIVLLSQGRAAMNQDTTEREMELESLLSRVAISLSDIDAKTSYLTIDESKELTKLREDILITLRIK